MTRFKGTYRIESTRLAGWDYRWPGAYFVTLCTRDHAPFLGNVVDGEVHLSPSGVIVAKEWKKTPLIRPHVSLDEWVVMPSHVHGIIVINEAPPSTSEDTSTIEMPWQDVTVRMEAELPRSRLLAGSLGAIIGQIKSVCTKRIRATGQGEFGWQTRFYDHIIRDEGSLDRVRTYIRDNPVQWELHHNSPACIRLPVEWSRRPCTP